MLVKLAFLLAFLKLPQYAATLLHLLNRSFSLLQPHKLGKKFKKENAQPEGNDIIQLLYITYKDSTILPMLN